MAGAKESVRGVHCLLPRRRLVRTSQDVQTEEEEAVAPLCPAILGCSSPQRTVGARGSQEGTWTTGLWRVIQCKNHRLCPRRPQVSGG